MNQKKTTTLQCETSIKRRWRYTMPETNSCQNSS